MLNHQTNRSLRSELNIPAFIKLSKCLGQLAAVIILNVLIIVDAGAQSLMVSSAADRSNAIALENAQLSSNAYIFLAPNISVSTIRSVAFFLDNPSAVGAPEQVERISPYDFAGTAPNDTAFLYDTSMLDDGDHSITAVVTESSGTETAVTANFTINNSSNEPNILPTATFTANCMNLNCSFSAIDSIDPDGQINEYSWSFGDGTNATGVSVSHAYSMANTFSVTLTVTDNRGGISTATQTVVTDNPDNTPPPTANPCTPISTSSCSLVRVVGSLELEFNSDAGGIRDRNDIGTGFTMVDPSSNPGNPAPLTSAPGLFADNIDVDTANGVLQINTTSGIQAFNINTQDNALGFGLNVPSTVVTLETTLTNIPPPAGGFSQAGLWFGRGENFGLGSSENNYIKLVIMSRNASGYVLQGAMEIDGSFTLFEEQPLAAGISNIDLKLSIDPETRNVTASANAGNGEFVLNTFTNVPDDWFSFDQAGIDPLLATRSFGGIFATNRRAVGSQAYSFDRVAIVETPADGGGTPPGPDTTNFEFNRWNFAVPSSPTAAAFGPDGRLYVTTLFGDIFAFTLDQNTQSVVDTQTISTLKNAQGDRLTLGIAIDPASTPSNVILWLSHSSGSTNNGAANSGTVSRLSGPNFTVQDVITGLPRAIANHAINGLDFGPDGRLYIAFGGNTGAGAPNLEPTEFGDRPEQPLSAAVLVADVNAPGFSGECATPIGQFGIPATCDAMVYASGLRNAYDLVWHANGSLYATDNGLGVTGTYPPVPTPDCTGLADANLHNPGRQADLLYRVLPGRYYGHPNPYRNECVFKDGSDQGVPPLPNYTPPLVELGLNLSANGIIDYRGDAFFGRLNGQLLIANFSRGDNISRTLLNTAGDAVIENQIMASGFNNPLGIAQDLNGNVFVTEFGASSIAVLQPQAIAAPSGNWSSLAPLPVPTLDAEGTSVNGELFVIAGETAAGTTSTMWIYNPTSNSWRLGPNLPGVAVEDAAAVEFGNKLYVFGGSTASFSGGVSNASVYDPSTNVWTTLAPMPTPRGGATAQMLNGMIYVLGGIGANGNSLTTVEIYNPATNSWNTGTPMLTARDNAGSARIGNRLYIFGGRTRFSNNTLSSIEIFDATSNIWNAGAPMPTGRRSVVVGTVGERIQVIGGENPSTNANEEYNPVTNSWRVLTPIPTARHGAVAGTIGGRLYVVGGGPVAGTTFTSSHQVFAY